MALTALLRETRNMLQAIKRLGVWGDSILKGIVQDAATKKYSIQNVSGLGAAAEKLGITLINRSHFGFTIERGKQTVIKDLKRGFTCEAGILEYGGNDCDYDWAEISKNPDADHTPRTPVASFVVELKHLVELLRANAIEPILMSLPPLVPERFFRHIVEPGLSASVIEHWLGDIDHLYRWQEMYSNAIVQLAKVEKCVLLDVRHAFLEERPYEKLLCEDGIHPNARGQALIGRVFSDLVLHLA
jgi:lysophospholipase L1-like esterase